MSVTCAIYGASDEEVEDLLRFPEKIDGFLRTAIPVERPGCIGSFLGRKIRVLPPTRPYFDLGKSWGAVHFVLAGTKNDSPLPNGFITSGGEYVGDVDVGYGPARVIRSLDVRNIARALEHLDVEAFRKGIDGKKMRPLHVSGAPSSDEPIGVQYLVDNYQALREFLLECSKSGQAIVIQYV